MYPLPILQPPSPSFCSEHGCESWHYIPTHEDEAFAQQYKKRQGVHVPDMIKNQTSAELTYKTKINLVQPFAFSVKCSWIIFDQYSAKPPKWSLQEKEPRAGANCSHPGQPWPNWETDNVFRIHCTVPYSSCLLCLPTFHAHCSRPSSPHAAYCRIHPTSPSLQLQSSSTQRQLIPTRFISVSTLRRVSPISYRPFKRT